MTAAEALLEFANRLDQHRPSELQIVLDKEGHNEAAVRALRWAAQQARDFAAAQVGEQDLWSQSAKEWHDTIETATIERCAQHLAERGWIEAAGELSKMKDEP